MADVFWTASTPVLPQGSYASGYLPVRVAGVGSTPDTFAQVSLDAVILATVTAISNGQAPLTLTDAATGAQITGTLQLSGGVLTLVAE